MQLASNSEVRMPKCAPEVVITAYWLKPSFSMKTNYQANFFRMRVEQRATDLLDRTHFLRNDVPGQEGSGKVPPLNVSSCG
jgi:hypothetical protein